MCRLFGMSGGRRRVRATFWLLDAPDSLADQSRRNPDGYGIATFEEDGSTTGTSRRSTSSTPGSARTAAACTARRTQSATSRSSQPASPAGTVRGRSGELAEHAAVLFASEQMDEDSGWRPLQPGELVRVSGDLEVSASVVLDEPPSRQLRLEDLHPAAAASPALGTRV